MANVINALPTSAQPTARRMLAEIRDAEDRAHAATAIDAFAHEFGAKWPTVTHRPSATTASVPHWSPSMGRLTR